MFENLSERLSGVFDRLTKQGALSEDDYDVPACTSHLSTPDGKNTCMSGGCLARRACPVAQKYQRDPAQSAYHMSQFFK